MFFKIQDETNNISNTEYIFVPDTPVLSSSSVFLTNLPISPHQRIRINADSLTREEINNNNEFANNFVYVDNHWWIHTEVIPIYMKEFPDIFNIEWSKGAPEGCEFIADTPIPFDEDVYSPFSVDYSLVPHICTKLNSNYGEQELKQIKEDTTEYVFIKQTGWWIQAKALPHYIKSYPSFFNIKIQ